MTVAEQLEARGREQGLKQGLQQGRQEGSQETQLGVLRPFQRKVQSWLSGL
ncbi:hypothetical protein [Vibrio parahaemolyticus]|uniref:hypothetical protein n=1 Tax=Vibrio parahaemolyticus TaxID=670 RepID=UPI001F5D683C